MEPLTKVWLRHNVHIKLWIQLRYGNTISHEKQRFSHFIFIANILQNVCFCFWFSENRHFRTHSFAVHVFFAGSFWFWYSVFCIAFHVIQPLPHASRALCSVPITYPGYYNVYLPIKLSKISSDDMMKYCFSLFCPAKKFGISRKLFSKV